MLNEQRKKEVDEFGKKFIELREAAKNSKEANLAFNKYKNQIFLDLKPYVALYTAKYKKFSNYQDLNRFGDEAIWKSLKTYKLSKGRYSFWFHRYVGTKIVRQAAAHAAIRISIRSIKKNPNAKPIKVDEIPIQVDVLTPEFLTEKRRQIQKLNAFIQTLEPVAKTIFCHHFQIDSKYKSVSDLCQDLNISKPKFKSILNQCLLEIRK